MRHSVCSRNQLFPACESAPKILGLAQQNYEPRGKYRNRSFSLMTTNTFRVSSPYQVHRESTGGEHVSTVGNVFGGRKTRIILGTGLALFSAVYLMALYLSFAHSVALEKNLSSEEGLQKVIQEENVLLQKTYTALAQQESSLLQSMEKISSLKYIRAQNVAVFNSQR